MVALRVIRELPKGNNTFGILFFNGHFQCFTLENTSKIIPEGEYKISLYDSPKNKMIVPLLNSVPGRSMIEIHPANWSKELEGCIAVGTELRPDMLVFSRIAFRELMSKISMDDEISIKVENQ